MYETAISILKRFHHFGFEAYIVGGYVRNSLLNLPTTDIDICTNATPDDTKKLFHVIKDHSKFGSVVIQKDDFQFEITTFRRDEYYQNRYPDITYVKTLKEDLQRRDFTINCLCLDQNENIIDLLNGKYDLNRKMIVTVKDPNQSFQEDPIRMLRALRFSLELNFSLDKNLILAIKDHRNLLKNLSENLRSRELQKIINKPNGVALLKKFGWDEYIL